MSFNPKTCPWQRVAQYNTQHWNYRVAQKISQCHKSSLDRIKHAIHFSSISTTKWAQGLISCVKYSICDLISDVIIFCVWGCNTGKINASDKIMSENQTQKIKYGNRRYFTYINLHLKDRLDIEFTTCWGELMPESHTDALLGHNGYSWVQTPCPSLYAICMYC